MIVRDKRINAFHRHATLAAPPNEATPGILDGRPLDLWNLYCPCQGTPEKLAKTFAIAQIVHQGPILPGLLVRLISERGL